MELRQLKYFVRTAQTLSFSEAARQLYISQSTLSQQIRQLEDELRCELLKRDSHKVVLTEYGEKMLPLAKRCLQDADDCVMEIANIKNLMIGSLNIGVTYTFSNILWYTMKEFLYTYKGVKLNVFYTNTEKLMHMLRKKEIDFALAYKVEDADSDFESFPLFDCALCAIMPKCHDLATRKSLSLKDLEKYPIAMPTKGVQGRRWIDRELQANPDIHLNVRIELNDANFLCKLVEQGERLITLLSKTSVANHTNLVAVPLEIENNMLHGCIHVMRDEYKKHTAQIFVKMLRESPVVMLMK
ncbi:MAG: LysR family transcriptional regulator [Prevotella sp.]|nr:LysR family transcriptional regulator [Candidatus Equicola faecalis]MDO4819625.1 LysR substrate-binding domain-containing protein [Prevotella sp.]